jgi:chloride channel protein, CIC family
MKLVYPRLYRVAAASIFGGMLIGVVGGAFRYFLIESDNWRANLVVWAHRHPYWGWTLPILLGAGGAWLARLLVVKFAPTAEGSGVQRVEAAYSGEVQPASAAVVPVKFFGGLLAMGGGLALGREGPTVQMGASFGEWISKLLLHDEQDRRAVQAASAGAGLAVAFNAPIGGSIFVFEELTSSITPWLLVSTLSSATVAVWLMRLMLGNTLSFTVQQVSLTVIWNKWPFLGIGLAMGILGAVYNLVIMRLLHISDTMMKLSSLQRATIIGAMVGVATWFVPSMVGGGDAITQAILSNQFRLATLVTIFAVRFVLGPWSYTAGCPGGLFAPLLLLGAASGAMLAGVINHIMPGADVSVVACAIIGMGSLFTASVRAPLTGIVLVVEMTGRADLTLGLLGASLTAMVVTMLLQSEPIYESLKRRMLSQAVVNPQRVDAGMQRPGE